jgi:hypothetical protein
MQIRTSNLEFQSQARYTQRHTTRLLRSTSENYLTFRKYPVCKFRLRVLQLSVRVNQETEIIGNLLFYKKKEA